MKPLSLKRVLAVTVVTAAVVAGAATTIQSLRAATAQGPAPSAGGTANVPGNEWMPARPASATATPLTPAEALTSFSVPPGYHVELVAAEPLVDSPILIDFDADGRMYVVEMPAFLPDLSERDSFEPVNRVVVLEDIDRDGKMDKRTVFADKLVMPRAIKVLDKGVLIAENPKLWYMRDTDGDLKADTRELVTDTYGRGGNVEHDANSLMWAMDNVMYSSEHVADLRLKNGKFEPLRALSRGQWQIAQDDAGRVYRNVNDAPLFVDHTPSRYFLRNPNAPRTRGLYEPIIEQVDATVYPVRPTRGLNRGYRDEYFRADGSSIVIQGTSGPTIYRGDKYPQSVRGDVFIADSPTNLVHQMTLVDDGSGRLSARNTYPRGEFFASSDERSRPVATYSAPDGNLYVIDMYRGVVQAGGLWSDYLTQYIRKNDMLLPVGYGRIWRVVYGTGVNTRGPQPSLSTATPAQLVATLSHSNGWWRDTAQQLLVQRGDRSVAPALQALAANAPDRRTRLHALWTLDGLDEITSPVAAKALSDTSADVRAAAVRISERWLPMPGHAIAASVLTLAQDPSWTVRRQIAASLGELPPDARIAPAVTVLSRDGNDPIVVDAVVSGLAGLESRVLQQIVQAAGPQQPAEAVTILGAAVMKGGDPAQVQNAVNTATDAQRPAWARRALLAGLIAALPPAPVVGRGAPVRLPGLSEPGSRTAAITAGRGVMLPAAPAALTNMAAGGGPEARLAAELAARLNWTGKPAPPAAPPVAPLSAEEQRRFEGGSPLYGKMCAGCHGPEGQGVPRLGASLANSRFVLAPPAIPIRILANGKEGPIGLMPPVVGQLSDDQLADVLTYIRRAWGNTASPVTPIEVRETRQSSVRTGVWTEEELAAMLPGARGRGGAGAGRGAPQPAGRGGQ
jgi:mono/diheme cytochrome c family protein/glucose/arabinose dehydrogenase